MRKSNLIIWNAELKISIPDCMSGLLLIPLQDLLEKPLIVLLVLAVIKINSAENLHIVYLIAPKVENKETAHFILQLSGKGTPRLTRYSRVIVTIIP
jgi:hypothetical protein